MKSLSTFLSIVLTPLIAVLPLQAEMAPASVPGPSNPSGQSTTLLIRLANAGNAVVEASSSLRGYAIQVTDASGLPVAEAAVAVRLPEDGATGYFTDGAHSAVAYTNSAGIAVFAQVNWGPTLGLADIRVTAVKGEMHAGAVIQQTIVQHSSVIPDTKAELKSLKPVPPQTGVQTEVANGQSRKTSVAAAPVTTGASPQPGTPASVRTGAAPQQTAQTAATAAPDPVVSIVNSGGSHSSSNKKWLVLAAVAAGAGVGAALALGGHGGAAAAASSGISIGSPSISVGH